MKTLTPTQEFLKLAKTKWGRKWRPKSAAALNVDPVTVWRWMQKENGPPLAALIALRSITKQNVSRETSRTLELVQNKM